MNRNLPVLSRRRQRGRSRRAAVATRSLSSLVLAAAALVVACHADDEAAASTSNGRVARVVDRLEALAFVPRGRTSIDSPLDVGASVDLLVDRYEVTVGEWRELFPGNDPIPAELGRSRDQGDASTRPTSWSTDVPVVGMTLDEARHAASLRGMRLPSFDEWMWCAVGPRTRRFPAGRQQRGLANTGELGLFRPTPVGAFESGQTPDTGVFDLLGNVWEWTDPPTKSGWKTSNPDAWPVDGGVRAPAWVVGGSYASPERPLFTRDRVLFVRATNEKHRSAEVGFRCVVDAEAYLGTLPVVNGKLDPATRARVVAVGARWGTRATDALASLVESQPRNAWAASLLEGASR